MNKLELYTKLPTGLAKGLNRFGTFWQKNGGLILNGAGVVSMLASTYFGVQAGRKIDECIDKVRAEIKKAEETGDKKLIRKAKIKGAKDICMVLGLPVGLAVAGATMIGCGTMKQREQVAGLAAAYCGVLAEYKDLKRRAAESLENASPLVDKDNKPVDREQAIAKAERDLGDGGVLGLMDKDNPECKDLVFHFDLNSKYEFLFDCRSSKFNRVDPMDNLRFLRGIWTLAKTKYDAGYDLYLSEVLTALDLPLTKASLVEGWSKRNKAGDNFISFGIEPFLDGTARVEDYEFLKDGIPLRFNCDGPIAYLLGDKDNDLC